MGNKQLTSSWINPKLYCLNFIKLLLISLVLCVTLVFVRLWNERTDNISQLEIVRLSIPAELHNNVYMKPVQWLDEEFCNISCYDEKPCVYKDQVDLRIIVITYDRDASLKKCLDSVLNIHTLEDRISVEIWIDRSPDGVIDANVNAVAQRFKHQWSVEKSKGRACVHYQPKNAFINGQWVKTWRPPSNSKELALILEDDVSISPMAYRWLKGVHRFFWNKTHIAGYSLQMENVSPMAPVNGRGELKADKNHNIFLFPVLGTWGFAPHPESWRKFQDFYFSARKNIFTEEKVDDQIYPIVPGIKPNTWYGCKSNGKESTWAMWHVKFSHDYHYFTVYSNLKYYTGRKNVLLDTNRKEKGLHFNGVKNNVQNNSRYLLTHWRDSYVDFSDLHDDTLVKFNYDGKLCSEDCCFSATCSGGMFERFWKRSFCQKIQLLSPFH